MFQIILKVRLVYLSFLTALTGGAIHARPGEALPQLPR